MAEQASLESQKKIMSLQALLNPSILIREMNFEALQLNNIHEQWRIDTRSFEHGTSLHDGDEIDVLLSEFKFKYERMPLTQKAHTKRTLTQFVGASLPLVLEPIVQPHKGRPLGAKNKKSRSTKRDKGRPLGAKNKKSRSTKRDPSAFEIIEEKSRKCGHCRLAGHDIRKCPVLKDKATISSFVPTPLPSEVINAAF